MARMIPTTAPRLDFINLDTAHPDTVAVYRERCRQKRFPVVTIHKVLKVWIITLDMSTTGQQLNAWGVRVYAILGQRLGQPDATPGTPLRAYSLATAEKAAVELVRLGRRLDYRTQSAPVGRPLGPGAASIQ